MLLSALVTVCVLQSIEPRPDAMEAGESIEVRTLSASGDVIGGVEVFVTPNEDSGATEEPRRLGLTDEDGRLEITMPEEPGPYRLEAVIQGVHCTTPIRAVDPVTRWPYALLGSAVGAFVLWNCRDLFRRSVASR
ncbi:MAG: hypothetical protein AAF196_06270 [Planctomycetota bacterium]